MFSNDSNDARNNVTNETDGDHMNVEEKHTTAAIVPNKKKVPLAMRRLKDFNTSGPCW